MQLNTSIIETFVILGTLIVVSFGLFIAGKILGFVAWKIWDIFYM